MITIKNLKIAEFMSEETICFSASVYEYGTKIAVATNDGHGGITNIHLVDNVGKSMSELFALEEKVDELVYAVYNQKQKDKIVKKLQRDFAKNICYGETTYEYYSIGFKKNKTSFAEIIRLHPKGLEHVQRLYDSVKSRLKGKERILNDNLASLGVKL